MYCRCGNTARGGKRECMHTCSLAKAGKIYSSFSLVPVGNEVSLSVYTTFMTTETNKGTTTTKSISAEQRTVIAPQHPAEGRAQSTYWMMHDPGR